MSHKVGDPFIAQVNCNMGVRRVRLDHVVALCG